MFFTHTAVSPCQDFLALNSTRVRFDQHTFEGYRLGKGEGAGGRFVSRCPVMGVQIRAFQAS